jgi:hypothetical protein
MERVIIGMDPHKRSVTIEARDRREVLRAAGTFPTTTAGYRAMRRFAAQWPFRVWRSRARTESADQWLCCVVRSQAMPRRDLGHLCWSDGQFEFVEHGGQPEQRSGVDCQLVMATT